MFPNSLLEELFKIFLVLFLKLSPEMYLILKLIPKGDIKAVAKRSLERLSGGKYKDFY